MMGPERKSHLLSKKEKKSLRITKQDMRLLLQFFLTQILYTKFLLWLVVVPVDIHLNYHLKIVSFKQKKRIFDDIAMSLGGYVAEEMVFGDITTGPSNDLQVSTALARAMVTRWG